MEVQSTDPTAIVEDIKQAWLILIHDSGLDPLRRQAIRSCIREYEKQLEEHPVSETEGPFPTLVIGDNLTNK